MDKEQAKNLKNKIHLLTFFITQCEKVDPLETDENEWHPDFEEAISQILFVNEHGYLEEDEMHELNELFGKWSRRFRQLGLHDEDLETWTTGEDAVEGEILEMLKAHLDSINSDD